MKKFRGENSIPTRISRFGAAIIKSAPYFNLDTLREETSELARVYSGQDSSLRAALVERLRHLVDDTRSEARRQLERDGDGRACAEGLSAFQDALIRRARMNWLSRSRNASLRSYPSSP